MKNISCLFVLDTLGVGGSERKTIATANLLAERGYQVHMAFLNLSYDLSGTVHDSINIIGLERSGKLDTRAIKKIRHYVRDNKIDFVWSVNLYPMIYAFLSTLFIGGDVRVVGSSNVSLFRNNYENFKMLIYLPIIWWLHHFVFGSVDQMDKWKRRYFLFKKNISVIHNGVNLKRFNAEQLSLRAEARKRYGVSEDDILIGIVAQFRIEKAHGDLIQAINNLYAKGKNVKLVCVGDGPTLTENRSLVEALGLGERVIFTGLMDDVRPALAAMDIFALTSRAVETFSNAALEAMAMGLPVVLSDLAGAREMVDEGVNGYLYAPGDIPALTATLERLLDPATREEKSLAARAVVEERFSAEAMADSYEAILAPVSAR